MRLCLPDVARLTNSLSLYSFCMTHQSLAGCLQFFSNDQVHQTLQFLFEFCERLTPPNYRLNIFEEKSFLQTWDEMFFVSII